MTLKEEITEILELFKIDAENDHADTNITTQDILEAFNKIVPEKIVLGETTTFNMSLEEVCRFDGSVEGFNQCVDQIEGAINDA
jgi:hypothetical protein